MKVKEQSSPNRELQNSQGNIENLSQIRRGGEKKDYFYLFISSLRQQKQKTSRVFCVTLISALASHCVPYRLCLKSG